MRPGARFKIERAQIASFSVGQTPIRVPQRRTPCLQAALLALTQLGGKLNNARTLIWVESEATQGKTKLSYARQS